MLATSDKNFIRKLTNKRETFTGIIANTNYIFKGFFANSHKYYQLEVANYTALKKTFKLAKLISAKDSDELYLGGLLQYQFLDYPSLSNEFINNPVVLEQVLVEINRLNKFGYSHLDPHLDNFLLDKKHNQVYLIDLSSIKKQDNADDSAFLLAQVPLSNFDYITELATRYKVPLEAVIGFYQRRKKHYYKKVLRHSSHFSQQQKGKTNLLVSPESENSFLHSFVTNCLAKDYYTIQTQSSRWQNTGQLLWQILNWLYLSGLSNLKPVAKVEQSYLGLFYSQQLVFEKVEKITICSKNSLLTADELGSLKNHKLI